MAEAMSPPEAEVKASEGHAQRQLNLSAAATIAVSIVFLLVAMTVARLQAMQWMGPNRFPVNGGTHRCIFATPWICPWTPPLQLPVNGTYEALPYEEHFVEVELPQANKMLVSPGPP